MFITLLQAAIARSTVVFMKLAEDQVGQFDVTVSPATDASQWAPPAGALNTTRTQVGALFSNMFSFLF